MIIIRKAIISLGACCILILGEAAVSAQNLPSGWTLQNGENSTAIYRYSGGEALILVLEENFAAADIDKVFKMAAQGATSLKGCSSLPTSKVNAFAGQLGRVIESKEVIDGVAKNCALIILSITPNTMRYALAIEDYSAAAGATKLAFELLQIGFDQANFQQPATMQNKAEQKDFDAGVVADQAGRFEEARTLFAKACDGGDAAGCSNLGAMLEQGKGGAADFEKARVYFAKACELGLKPACRL